jgi:hypothetical protein
MFCGSNKRGTQYAELCNVIFPRPRGRLFEVSRPRGRPRGRDTVVAGHASGGVFPRKWRKDPNPFPVLLRHQPWLPPEGDAASAPPWIIPGLHKPHVHRTQHDTTTLEDLWLRPVSLLHFLRDAGVVWASNHTVHPTSTPTLLPQQHCGPGRPRGGHAARSGPRGWPLGLINNNNVIFRNYFSFLHNGAFNLIIFLGSALSSLSEGVFSKY